MQIPRKAQQALQRAVSRARGRHVRAELIRAYAREWGVSEATARRHASQTPRPAARGRMPTRTEWERVARVMDADLQETELFDAEELATITRFIESAADLLFDEAGQFRGR